MVFTSQEFVLAFLPITLMVFLGAVLMRRKTLALIWLIVASFFFYGWWEASYCLLLGVSITLNYGVGRVLEKRPSKPVLVLGIAVNLLFLGYFKYTNFMIGTVSSLIGGPSVALNIVLPLAISFFTFQQIAYLVDVYQGRTTEPNFLQYCLFVCFFPQFIAGPIVHHSETIPQFQKRSFVRIDPSDLLVGLAIFVIGFDKKVFIADAVATIANPVFDGALVTPPTFVDAWCGSLAYTFQLYFDFSGYSDMAIGLARMFGIRLPLNFHSPYKAVNIIDFWRRWHMTLSRFLRNYLYIPLGGNRKGRGRRHVNLMMVMLLGGLWHGAGWTFAAWGGLHGVFLMVNHGWHALKRAAGRTPAEPTAWGIGLGRIITFLCVVAAWVLFRAEDWTTAFVILKGMAGLNGMVLPGELLAATGGFGALLTEMGIAAGPVPSLDGPGVLWLGVLLAIVWFAPNTQEIMGRYEPALDFVGKTLAGDPITPAWSAFLDRLHRRLDAARTYVLIPLLSGSAVLAALITLSRGSMSTEFIYMIF